MTEEGGARALARRAGLRHGWDMARRRFTFAMLARGVVFAGLALILVFAGLVALYAFARPVSTLMLGRMAVGQAATSASTCSWPTSRRSPSLR